MTLSKEKIINDFMDDMEKDGLTFCDINYLNALVLILNRVAKFIDKEFKDKNENVEIGYEIARSKLWEAINGEIDEIKILN